MNNEINIGEFGYKEDIKIIEAVKSFLLLHDFTIIQNSDKYFTYSKDNKFGNFAPDSYSGYNLSSVYVGSQEHGTGSQYKKSLIFSIDDFYKSFNFVINRENKKLPKMYKDIGDYLSSSYSLKDIKIINKQGIKKPVDMLEGYYFFKSNAHGLVISKNHSYLFNKFFSRKDEYKAIFLIENNKLKTINHNINLFEDMREMQDLKNNIL